MSAPRPDRTPDLPLILSEAGKARALSPEEPADRHARGLIARIRKNWNDVDAIRGLANHYTSTGDYASLANLMEGWGDALEDPRRAADAYVEAADALLLANRPADEARLLFERALSRDASHTRALDRVTRVLEDARNYDRLKQVLKYVGHQLQEQNADVQLISAVHHRLGQVYEKHFDEPRKAATLYRMAIEANPRYVVAIAAARKLYLEQGDHKTASALYEFEVEATTNTDDKHALLLAVARHKREQCDDLDGAVLAFRRAVKLVPASTRALLGLGEALLARSERADELAAAADRQRAAEVFFHLAERVPAPEATGYLQRALLVVPGHARARALLDSLARKSNGQNAASPPPPPPKARVTSEAEDWLRNPPPPPTVDELSSEDMEPIDDETAASLLSSRANRPPSFPPATLQSPPPPRPKPREPAPQPAIPQPMAAVAQPQPAALPAHPKIVDALPQDFGRVPLEVNVGSTTDSNFYIDDTDHVLDGGVFVATYSPLPMGSEVALAITLPGKQVARAHARVVLTRDLMDAFDDHIPGMCLAFERVDPRSCALIERFVRKRPPTFLD